MCMHMYSDWDSALQLNLGQKGRASIVHSGTVLKEQWVGWGQG